MRRFLFAVLSFLSLALSLAFPMIYFLGKMPESRYKLCFLLASVGWFVFASLWASARKSQNK
jgi:hypothetical protein